jgi:hypothetical protein
MDPGGFGLGSMLPDQLIEFKILQDISKDLGVGFPLREKDVGVEIQGLSQKVAARLGRSRSRLVEFLGSISGGDEKRASDPFPDGLENILSHGPEILQVILGWEI